MLLPIMAAAHPSSSASNENLTANDDGLITFDPRNSVAGREEKVEVAVAIADPAHDLASDNWQGIWLSPSFDLQGCCIAIDAITRHEFNTSAYFFKKASDLIDFKSGDDSDGGW